MAPSSTENGKEFSETTRICYQHGKPVIRCIRPGRHQWPGDTLMHSWRAVGYGYCAVLAKQGVPFSLFPAAADRILRLGH